MAFSFAAVFNPVHTYRLSDTVRAWYVRRCTGLTQFSARYQSRRDALLVRASLALRVAALYYYCCDGVFRDHNL